jgi:hypothetical protein
MRAPTRPDNQPLYNYTLMPTHMRQAFSLGELRTAKLVEPFSFSKGCRLMRIKPDSWWDVYRFGSLLFDLEADPRQEHPLEDPRVEAKMIAHLVRLMKENDAPVEQFERLGLCKA